MSTNTMDAEQSRRNALMAEIRMDANLLTPLHATSLLRGRGWTAKTVANGSVQATLRDTGVALFLNPPAEETRYWGAAFERGRTLGAMSIQTVGELRSLLKVVEAVAGEVAS